MKKYIPCILLLLAYSIAFLLILPRTAKQDSTAIFLPAASESDSGISAGNSSESPSLTPSEPPRSPDGIPDAGQPDTPATSETPERTGEPMPATLFVPDNAGTDTDAGTVPSSEAPEALHLPATYTGSSRLNLRLAPSMDAPVAAKFEKNSSLIIRSFVDSVWAEVEYEGQTLYCVRQYLTYHGNET